MRRGASECGGAWEFTICGAGPPTDTGRFDTAAGRCGSKGLVYAPYRVVCVLFRVVCVLFRVLYVLSGALYARLRAPYALLRVSYPTLRVVYGLYRTVYAQVTSSILQTLHLPVLNIRRL